MSEEIQTKSELEVLKERADKMGIKYHPNVGVETLRERVNAALTGNTQEESKDADTASEAVETEAQKRQRLKKEALKLVRVRVTNMDPNKKEWEGEVWTVSNSVIGTVKRYVPYNADEGWHVEQIILNAMKVRKCQIFQKARGPRGEQITKPKLINALNIEILPPLTEKELKELAQRQAMANGTSD